MILLDLFTSFYGYQPSYEKLQSMSNSDSNGVYNFKLMILSIVSTVLFFYHA